MFKCLLASCLAVSTCLGALHSLCKPVPVDLTLAQWLLIEQLAKVLKLFKKSTKFLLHQHLPTLGPPCPLSPVPLIPTSQLQKKTTLSLPGSSRTCWLISPVSGTSLMARPQLPFLLLSTLIPASRHSTLSATPARERRDSKGLPMRSRALSNSLLKIDPTLGDLMPLKSQPSTPKT